MDDRRDPSPPPRRWKKAKTSAVDGIAPLAPPDPAQPRAVDRESDDRRRPAESDEEGLDEEPPSDEQRLASGDQGYDGDDDDEEEEDFDSDDSDEEEDEPEMNPDARIARNARNEEIVRRVVAELRSDQVSMDRLAGLFREEYDGKSGTLGLWRVRDSRHTTVFDLCFKHLSKASMEALIRRAVLEHPGLLSRSRNGYSDFDESLLHLAVQIPETCDRARAQDRLELIRLLVRLDRNAVTVANEWGRLPIHEACYCRDTVRSDVLLPIIQLLVEEDPTSLEVDDLRENLPLHLLCGWFYRDEPQFLAAVQLLIDQYPLALNARLEHGMTPVMNAIGSVDSEALLQPAKLDLLRQMILRGGPSSLWGENFYDSFIEFPGDFYNTALQLAYKKCQHPKLISTIVETWPLTLCLSFCEGLPNTLGIMLASEARAALLALIEVVLHDTTTGAVLGRVRDHVRGVVDRLVAPGDTLTGNSRSSLAVAQRIHAYVRGDAFRELRTNVLNKEDLQSILTERLDLQDFRAFVTGVCRMNMAGRLGPEEAGDASRAWGAAVPAEQHARILAAAGDNLSSLFHHLRDCSLDLFAGFGAAGRGS